MFRICLVSESLPLVGSKLFWGFGGAHFAPHVLAVSLCRWRIGFKMIMYLVFLKFFHNPGTFDSLTTEKKKQKEKLTISLSVQAQASNAFGLASSIHFPKKKQIPIGLVRKGRSRESTSEILDTSKYGEFSQGGRAWADLGNLQCPPETTIDKQRFQRKNSTKVYHRKKNVSMWKTK